MLMFVFGSTLCKKVRELGDLLHAAMHTVFYEAVGAFCNNISTQMLFGVDIAEKNITK